MKLEEAIVRLEDQLGTLATTLVALRVSLVEDRPVRPKGPGLALFDQLELAVDDTEGMVEEARQAAAVARNCVAVDSPERPRLQRALSVCQNRLQKIQRRQAAELASPERIRELRRVGEGRRGEWLGWTLSVSDALEGCGTQILDAAEGLAEVWMMLAERGAGTSVSVQTSAVGQKVCLSPQETIEELN